MGLEGLVSKHRDRPYRGGRQKFWIKVKNRSHLRWSANCEPDRPQDYLRHAGDSGAAGHLANSRPALKARQREPAGLGNPILTQTTQSEGWAGPLGCFAALWLRKKAPLIAQPRLRLPSVYALASEPVARQHKPAGKSLCRSCLLRRCLLRRLFGRAGRCRNASEAPQGRCQDLTLGHEPVRFGIAIWATFGHPQVISVLANCLFNVVHGRTPAVLCSISNPA
jgi:hypothetical protein